jgi:hypothetical protein
MNKPVLWTIDEARRLQLEVIAGKLKLGTYAEVMNLAIDEFIVKHGTPAQLKPEPPVETEKDTSHRKRIAELAATMQISRDVIRRDITKLSADQLHRKYGIDPRALREFREYVRRTES